MTEIDYQKLYGVSKEEYDAIQIEQEAIGEAIQHKLAPYPQLNCDATGCGAWAVFDHESQKTLVTFGSLTLIGEGHDWHVQDGDGGNDICQGYGTKEEMRDAVYAYVISKRSAPERLPHQTYGSIG